MFMKKPENYYLKSGSQTEQTGLIKKISKSFKEKELYLIIEILYWLKKNIKQTKSIREKNKFFRKRTADEIIKSRIATGCTDCALAFIAIARVKGIPTKYVETIRNKWFDIEDNDFIEGHVFAECYINGKWHIIDPQEGDIKTAYKRFTIFKKGLDSWDIGIENIDDLKNKFLKFKEEYRAKKS